MLLGCRRGRDIGETSRDPHFLAKSGLQSLQSLQSRLTNTPQRRATTRHNAPWKPVPAAYPHRMADRRTTEEILANAEELSKRFESDAFEPAWMTLEEYRAERTGDSTGD